MLAVSQFDRIAILGLGLIGGSLLRRLADHPVVGFDADGRVRAMAQAEGFDVVDSVREAVADADVIILAAPLAAIPDLVAAVTEFGQPGVVLTDVASVKVPVREAVLASGGNFRYVGGHPMAGTEESGFSASRADLFANASYVLCLEQHTDLTAWLSLAALISEIGCNIVVCSATIHDGAVARISGLSHVFAATLAIAGAEGGPSALALAAGSFRDGTRVAGSNPQMTAALCDQNRIELAQVLDKSLARLTAARDSLINGSSVVGLMNDGLAARQEWAQQQQVIAERRAIADQGTLRLLLTELANSGATLRITPSSTGVDCEITRTVIQ